jgi:hypothetical protein
MKWHQRNGASKKENNGGQVMAKINGGIVSGVKMKMAASAAKAWRNGERKESQRHQQLKASAKNNGGGVANNGGENNQ